VFPILDWSYNQVWQYLKGYNMMYCVLYDQGYTSLGEKHNTIKNPHLQIEGTDNFRPAFELTNDD
jgi:FAD synthetase